MPTPATPVIVWDVYGNGGAGGPVDYSTPLATGLTLPTWTSPALGLGSDNTFAVRARDTANGVDDLNVDARVRIVVDGAGLDVSARPAPPQGLTVTAGAGGTAEVEWWSPPGLDGPQPTSFRVWLATVASGPMAYGAPSATVAARASGGYYRTTLTGLSDGVDYQIGLRAVAGTVAEANTTIGILTGSAVAPDDVDDLTVTIEE